MYIGEKITVTQIPKMVW